jgi:Domain of unknown function (DUF3644)
MRREARLLLIKAIDSLVLSVEQFNRADERGRVSTVLILLDHSFEMLLKASILHRGGKIREPRARETVGFDACVRRALSDANIKFLEAVQALTMQTINGLRDAAQHHLIDVSEQQLYLHSQSGVTLFRDILKSVFGEDLAAYLPARVLPISTVAPSDLTALFQAEASEIIKLLQPSRRRKTEAYARLRPLAILDATIRGEKLQPGQRELRACAEKLNQGISWNDVFVGAASVQFTTNGSGPSIALRLTKKEGIPVQLVPEGTPGASVVAVKRVNELDFYNLGHHKLAEHVGLSPNKTTAAIWCLNIQSDPDCFRELVIGKSRFKRYSQKAIDRIKEILAHESIDQIWEKYKAHQPPRSRKHKP